MARGFGGWAFLIGVILAVIFGFVGKGSLNSTLTLILFIIGIIVGLLNVTDKEATPFMMAAAVLVIVAALGGQVLNTITWLGGILQGIMVLFIPATVVVAVRSVFMLAKD